MNYKWLYLKVAIFLLASYSLVTFPWEISGAPWFFVVIPVCVFPIMIYLFLSANCKANDVCFKKAFSLNKPFYPIKTYPLQYWSLTSLYLLFGGIMCVCNDLFKGIAVQKGSVLILLLGVGILISVSLFIKTTTNK